MSGEFGKALAESMAHMQKHMENEMLAYMYGIPLPPEQVEENERIMADLYKTQPESWVEDRRVRLTTRQAERGVSPTKYTPLEWRRMNAASQAYHDRLALAALQRAQLGA